MNDATKVSNVILAPLPWQGTQWARINSLHQAGKLPHALLLRGPAGTGKVAFAQAMAQRMLCAHPSADLACGQCKYCKLFAANTHPDFFVAQPEEGGRAIKVDLIRDLITFASKKAQFEGYRVVLVQPAEAMNINASNALLKCLEEPGGNTLIMLVSHQPSQLLPTVRSRCQSVEFPVPEMAVTLPWLANIAQNETVAKRLLALAGGCPMKAASLATGDWQKQREHTFELWYGLQQKKMSMVEVAEALAKYPLVDVMEWLAGWYVDIARLALNPGAPLLDEEKRERLLPLASVADSARFFASYDQVMELRAAFMRGANFNPQMALEGLMGVLRA